MSTIKVNTVENRTGSTLTLGKSGTTIQLACGATQTGFGRSGSVNWCTTAKTSPFTAANGVGYFVNTTGGVVTVTLPASPSAGDIVAIKDYARTFGNNKVTVGRNGSNMDGTAANTCLVTTGLSVSLIFVDATKGWQFVNDDITGAAGSLYMQATGGTITTSCCGDFKIHTFVGDGTFCVSCAGNAGGNNQMEYLVVAGGGSGGSENGQSVAGGGGGAGGFRFASPSLAPGAYPAKPLAAPATLTAAVQPYTVSVGGGGAVAPTGTTAGDQSVFSTITSAGGGGGGYTGAPGPSGLRGGNPGGSGGGASHGTSNPGPSGGAGNTPPVSPPQGNPGGGMEGGGVYLGAGGGGALAVGGQAPTSSAGAGGVGGGLPTAFGSNGVPCGSFRYYAGGGGGGGSTNRPQTGSAQPGGLGGGAAGGAGQNPAPANATVNTGGGGGGAGNEFPNPGTPLTGSAGGSGIVVIRYRFQN